MTKGEEEALQQTAHWYSISCYSEDQLTVKFDHLLSKLSWCPEYKNNLETPAHTSSQLGDSA